VLAPTAPMALGARRHDDDRGRVEERRRRGNPERRSDVMERRVKKDVAFSSMLHRGGDKGERRTWGWHG
jgi:hypothetical protein